MEQRDRRDALIETEVELSQPPVLQVTFCSLLFCFLLTGANYVVPAGLELRDLPLPSKGLHHHSWPYVSHCLSLSLSMKLCFNGWHRNRMFRLFIYMFERRSHCVAQARLHLLVFPPQCPSARLASTSWSSCLSVPVPGSRSSE